MKFIIKPPRCGKTTELIKLALENNACIVVANEEMKETLCRQAKMPKDIRCFTAKEIKERRHRGIGYIGIKCFVIDDIEIFLQHFFPCIPVIAVAGTEG